MAHSLIPFLFEDSTLVRVTDQNGDPWFLARDICAAVGIRNHRDAVEKLDEDEKGVVISDTLGGSPVGNSDTSGRNGVRREHLIVSEGGLYALILRSHAAMRPGTVAHRFRRWVTSDLLPQIRKTGHYDPTGRPAALNPATEAWGDKLRLVAECRLAWGVLAERQLWLALGLPTVPEMLRPAQGEFSFGTSLDDEPPATAAEVN